MNILSQRAHHQLNFLKVHSPFEENGRQTATQPMFSFQYLFAKKLSQVEAGGILIGAYFMVRKIFVQNKTADFRSSYQCWAWCRM